MATTFKTFLNDDLTSTKTLLHEAIPLTGAIASGTYNEGGATTDTYNGTNIKNYAHGIFQSVYDYPYLSSSANHIFDLSVGYASSSVLSGAVHDDPAVLGSVVQQQKKINMYNQMAQVLVGLDQTGSIRKFDEDGDLTAGTKMKECLFLDFSRLLVKDEIKKGSFTIRLGTGSYADPFHSGDASADDSIITISDAEKDNDYRVNSPAGEYAILSCTLGYGPGWSNPPACGLIFYQAGIVVLSSSVFQSGSNEPGVDPGGVLGGTSSTAQAGSPFTSTNAYFTASLSGSAISGSCNYFRNRIFDISFNNTTELNSTIHFCRINHNDFNYSSNPTYLSASQIVVKNSTLDTPVSFFTTIGLYSSDNELLAVAKVSEPLKKDPTNEMTIRVRLDY